MLSSWGGRFSILFTIGLGIVALWLAFGADDSLSYRQIALTIVLVLMGIGVVSIVLLLLHQFLSVGLARLLRRFAVWVTFRTIRDAISKQRRKINPLGITTVDDGVGVVLPIGRQDGVMEGERFIIENFADQEKWGTLQVAWVNENTCTCSVSDRINEEFWGNLERRMRSEPSFPNGVAVRREIPEEYILDWLQALLK